MDRAASGAGVLAAPNSSLAGVGFGLAAFVALEGAFLASGALATCFWAVVLLEPGFWVVLVSCFRATGTVAVSASYAVEAAVAGALASCAWTARSAGAASAASASPDRRGRGTF